MGPILIVDDEFGIVEALQDLLRDEGYRTATAFNGVQALARMAEERPALVLLDYMMPLMNGEALLAKMRADPALADLPVALMSASAMASRQGLAIQAFLAKPFDLNELLSVVHALAGPPPPIQ